MRIKRKEEASMFRAHGGGVHTQDAPIANSEEDISCKKYESICTSVCVCHHHHYQYPLVLSFLSRSILTV